MSKPLIRLKAFFRERALACKICLAGWTTTCDQWHQMDKLFMHTDPVLHLKASAFEIPFGFQPLGLSP
jgi:hypothetical protein